MEKQIETDMHIERNGNKLMLYDLKQPEQSSLQAMARCTCDLVLYDIYGSKIIYPIEHNNYKLYMSFCTRCKLNPAFFTSIAYQ